MGEVEEAISVADAAIIVVNCKAGIEVGVEKAWEMCEKYNLPRLFFVTNMDDDHASYRELVLKLETRFGRKIAPFQLPIRENEKFVGYVNVVKMAGRRFTELSNYTECEIPDYVQKNLGIAREALMEAVAETSEEYMERYFSGEEFTQEEISKCIEKSCNRRGYCADFCLDSVLTARDLPAFYRPLTNTSQSPRSFARVHWRRYFHRRAFYRQIQRPGISVSQSI